MRSLRRCRVLPRVRPHPVYVISRGRLRRAFAAGGLTRGKTLQRRAFASGVSVGRLRRTFTSDGTAIIGRIPGGRYYGLLSSYITVAPFVPDFHKSGRIGVLYRILVVSFIVLYTVSFFNFSVLDCAPVPASYNQFVRHSNADTSVANMVTELRIVQP